MQPPAGAISMFGPGTKNILEGLKKRRPSTSEESAKSEEVETFSLSVVSIPAVFIVIYNVCFVSSEWTSS